MTPERAAGLAFKIYTEWSGNTNPIKVIESAILQACAEERGECARICQGVKKEIIADEGNGGVSHDAACDRCAELIRGAE